MMTRESTGNRKQLQIISLDELVPEDHLVRKLEAALDWSFIYEMVEGSYSEDNGRPSIDHLLILGIWNNADFAHRNFMIGQNLLKNMFQPIYNELDLCLLAEHL